MKRASVFVCLTVIAVGGVIAWMAGEDGRERQRGAELAREHWENGFAISWVKHCDEYQDARRGLHFTQNYDRDNGFAVRHYNPRKAAFCDGYNSAMVQLVKENGIPPWSARNSMIADDELAGMLDASGMQRIAAFPYEASENIVITSGGAFSRWGGVSYGETPSIETRLGGTICTGSRGEPFYIAHPLLIRRSCSSGSGTTGSAPFTWMADTLPMCVAASNMPTTEWNLAHMRR